MDERASTLQRRDLTCSQQQLNVWKFIGPALLVSVGYMDPGNWATDLEGGARFGYSLLWVLLVSNAVALLLQSLSARLGIAGGIDLATGCREHYPAPLAHVLWLLAEIAIIACDLAELLGSAVALQLLFGLPLALGALVTSFDVLLILAFERRGKRRLEAIVLALLVTVALCMLIELILAGPRLSDVVTGLAPRLGGGRLYIAIGILGATVMPHNLYLHSALCAQRSVSSETKTQSLRNSFASTAIALNIALLVNAAILILAAAVFHKRGLSMLGLDDAYRLLAPVLGSSVAPVLFAVALLCAGQSASVSGTLAGQYIMEGFLRLRLAPAKRRLVTRGLALIPALLMLLIVGDSSVMSMLVASQVVLSFQLPFAIVPLIRLTSSPAVVGEHAISLRTRWLASMCAVLIVAANAVLIANIIGDLELAGVSYYLPLTAAGMFGLALLVLVASVPLRGGAHQGTAAHLARDLANQPS